MSEFTNNKNDKDKINDNDIHLDGLDDKNNKQPIKEKEIKLEEKNFRDLKLDDNNSSIYLSRKLMKRKELDKNQLKEIKKAKKKYSSFIEKQKNKTDLLELVDKTVKKIYNFDLTNQKPEEKDNFFCVNALDEEEKNFSDCFASFNDIINKEGKNIKQNKKKNFLFQNNFKNKINQEEKLSKIISELEKSHPQIMEENEKKTNLDELIPTLNENFDDKILGENEIIKKFNSPIGRLEDTKNFIYKFDAHKNYHLMINAYKHFNYWRTSLSDGNSFYRVFMYSLIENYITNQNINELKKLICDIIQEDYITLYRNKGIDVYIVLQIFNKIISLLENNQIEESYKIFNKAYRLKNHCFDYTMIFYLRNIVYKYTKEVYNIYNNNLKEKNKEIDDLINIDAINELGFEPEFFILIFIPYLFDVNLKIFWVDGNLQKNEDGFIDFVDDENEGKFPYIIMGYFFSNFFPLYSNKINDNLNKIINERYIRMTKLTYCDENKKICPICNNETEQVIFLQKKFIICKPCLISHVDKIIMKRTLSLNNEDYYGFEYYNRPIHLQDDYYINNYEIIELKKENISNLLLRNQTMSCCQCQIKIEKNEYLMNCGCFYCEKCFMINLKNSTNEYMYINEFEKQNNTFEKVICSCGKNFDISYASKIYKPSNEERNNAKERMKIYVKTLCYQCLQKLVEYDNENNNYKIIEKYHKVYIKKESEKRNNIEYYDGQHIICKNCYVKQKKKILNEQETNEEEESNQKIIRQNFCKICNRNHIEFIDDEEGKTSCSENCVII